MFKPSKVVQDFFHSSSYGAGLLSSTAAESSQSALGQESTWARWRLTSRFVFLDVGVSIATGEYPQELDGLVQGKSQSKMDDLWVSPFMEPPIYPCFFVPFWSFLKEDTRSTWKVKVNFGENY